MLKELTLKKTYDSETDDLLGQFYIPALQNSKFYNRITGYFSAQALVSAAKGLSNFFVNNGHYKLITGIITSEKDFDAIKSGLAKAEDVVPENLFLDEDVLYDEIQHDYLKILAYLIRENRLDIKIAVLPESQRGIFHEKIGIFEDEEGDKVSFSGSINETGKGWGNNKEEFKVFRSWDEGQNEYLNTDCDKFDKYWNNRVFSFNVIDIPTAIKRNLINIGSDENIESVLKRISSRETKESEQIKLHPFQNEAIKCWIENGSRGILEMATGTGKTYTALGAAKIIINKFEKICLIISVPYTHLATQWSKDVSRFFPKMIVIAAHSQSIGWEKKVSEFLSDFRDGNSGSFAIIVTYDTLASEKFIHLFSKKMNKNNAYMLISDEVHNMGSSRRKSGMIDGINFRLGLSATPMRWRDEEGTEEIKKYFDKSVFKYDLKQAIEDGFLSHYTYHPIFVKMSEDEMEKYEEFTLKISKSFRGGDININNSYMSLLLIQRSKVLKNIKSKINRFEELITTMRSNNKTDHLLVYCDASDQLKITQEIINKYGIINHQFTQEESNEEREKILKNFDTGVYDCLVAIKCLDEGVNVPSTKRAIILASTTNPREYIQRRGRVLRKIDGQEKIAEIYDFTVLPPDDKGKEVISETERKIFKNELTRIEEFLDTADNKAEVLIEINQYMLKYEVYL